MAADDAEEYLAFTRRVLRALAERVGEADAEQIVEMMKLADDLETQIGRAIFFYLDDQENRNIRQRSWTALARQLGVTRQTVHQRWGAAVKAARAAFATESPEETAARLRREQNRIEGR